jgi:hypothetical protein
MSLPDITPTRFFVDGSKKLFQGDERRRVRHEPELIRPVG